MKTNQVHRPSGFNHSLIFPSLLKSFKVLLKRFCRNKFNGKDINTYQYPEVKRPIAIRWKGRQRLLKNTNGQLRCNSCLLCQQVCPANCITIGKHDEELEQIPYSFKIDHSRCIYCGFCTEVCPVDAIRMDSGVHSIIGAEREELEFKLVDLVDNERKKIFVRDSFQPPKRKRKAQSILDL